MTDVVVPNDLWEDDSEGVIAVWFFRDGERVRAGDVLADVMNEKATSTLEAPASGTITIVVQPDVPVVKGQVVARIE